MLGTRSGRTYAWLLGAGLVAVLCSVLIALGTPRSAYPDSSFYLQRAFLMSGQDAAGAARATAAFLCETDRVGLDLTSEKCQTRIRRQLDTVNPTYASIFWSRPAYPALLALGLRAWGPSAAVPMTVTVAALAGWALSLLLWRITSRAWVAPLGVLVWFLTPAGIWTTALLAEGLALLLVFAATACAWGVWQASDRSRRALSAVGLTVAVAGLAATKSASGFATCVGLAAAIGVACLLVPAWRARQALWAATLLGGLAAATLVVGWALGWAGLSVTVADFVTRHFVRPEPARMWVSYLRLLPAALVEVWNGAIVAEWYLWLPSVAGAAALLWWGLRVPQRGAWLLLGAALPGIAVVVVHPIATEADRLALPWFLTIPAGVAVVVAAALRRPARSSAARGGRLRPASRGGTPEPTSEAPV